MKDAVEVVSGYGQTDRMFKLVQGFPFLSGHLRCDLFWGCAEGICVLLKKVPEERW
jgi:hypothetical protein